MLVFWEALTPLMKLSTALWCLLHFVQEIQLGGQPSEFEFWL